jgi:Ca-activated chloride channel family protein
MSLNWPWALIALLIFPLLLGYRWWTRRRRRREAVRMSSVTLIRAALPGRSLWRRRIPLWLFAVGLVVLATGAARPQASVLVPSNSATILLAIDVSASMCSTDVAPNRITVAEKAAREFIKAQPSGVKIGLVAFSGIAGLLVAPTTDKDALLAAIDTLRTSRGTAIGLAILAAIDAIAEINPNVAATGVDLQGGDASGTGTGTGTGVGEYEPDVIIVLTDGANTQGVDPVTAAAEASARHLRIYTIGFGTTQPAPAACSPDQISGGAAIGGDRRAGGGFGGGGFGGGRNQQIDEETLTKVAENTGGKYFKAENSAALTDVLLDLPSSISLQRKDMEITVWFALGGALLLLVAIGLAQWWNRTGPFLNPPVGAVAPAARGTG